MSPLAGDLTTAEEEQAGYPAVSCPFSKEEFDRARALIYRSAGISLSPVKKDMVYSRLTRRLRATGVHSFSEYLGIVEGGDARELEAFVNALTTNMTSFFREGHHFRILAEHLAALPETRPVSIWTCAASTGEEPYSIAMTAAQSLPAGAPRPRILATDINTRVLEAARAGIYPLEQVTKLPAAQVRRFFLRGEGKHEGYARVKDELKRLVSYRRLNLMDREWPMRGLFDAIFCRNVLIYFDRQTQQGVLEKLSAYLRPDGLLFLGHSENYHSHLFTVRGHTVYAPRREKPA